MDPLDHARQASDGTACAVCGGPVGGRSIHLLASRDDLAFVEVECDTCRSTTLAFVLDVVTAPVDDSRPVSADDVLDMHRLLSGWHGGLRELLASRADLPGATS